MGNLSNVIVPYLGFAWEISMKYIHKNNSVQIQGYAVDVCGFCDIGYIGLDWTWKRKVANGVYVRGAVGPCISHN
jgi:hypothetical protein